jgi:hemolysin activation/secretion protein
MQTDRRSCPDGRMPIGFSAGFRHLPLFGFLLLSLVRGAAAQDGVRFPILEIQVIGNTVLPSSTIEEVVLPHVGLGKTAADVEKARDALEEAYGRAGYATVSVEVPRQRVNDGIINLRVVERAVGRLRVTGAQYHSPRAVREAAPSVAEGTVPRTQDLQRDIIALNRQPDRKVVPELVPGREPDTVDVNLRVEDRLPLHGTVELNNRQVRGTTALRSSASLRYENLWQRGDTVSAWFQTAPQRMSDGTVVMGSYLWRVPNSAASVLTSFTWSDSNLAAFNGSVIGRGTTIGSRLILPLGGGGAGFSHSLSAGMDRKSYLEGVPGDTPSAGALSIPITYYPVSAGYQASVAGERSDTEFGITAVFNVRGLGSSDATFARKRADATASFFVLRGDVAHTHRLDGDWQLWARTLSQYSPDALIANEQFAIGGVDTVRGYYEAAALVDYGVAVQTEIRTPSLSHLVGQPLNELRFHGFVDGGFGALNNPLPQQTRSYSMGAAGVGARAKLYDHLNAAVDGAAVLTDGPGSRAGGMRLLFRLWGGF